MSNKIVAAVIVLALCWGVVVSADVISGSPWTNLARFATASGNDAASSVHYQIGTEYWINNNNTRWHQGRTATPQDPCYIAFDLGEDNSAWIGYARMYNLSDNVNGLFDYHLEYLPAGADNLTENWIILNETFRTDRKTIDGDIFILDQAVNARAIRWVLTGGTEANYRFNRFEFFTENQHALNLANLPGATLTSSNDPNVLGSDAAAAHDGYMIPRFDSGNHYVTLMLPEAYQIQHLRLYNEDGGSSIGEFSIEYLLADGETWATVPGLGNLTGQPNIAEYDLSTLPATTGLRMNIITLSTQGHNVLRLNQFEAFGVAVPEPATMALLALGGLAMLRRRK